MITDIEVQWKSTWSVVRGLQVVLFEQRLYGSAGLSPEKTKDKDSI